MTRVWSYRSDNNLIIFGLEYIYSHLRIYLEYSPVETDGNEGEDGAEGRQGLDEVDELAGGDAQRPGVGEQACQLREG